MNVTPLVGRFVPLLKAVSTEYGQVIVQCPEEVERSWHIPYFSVMLVISKLERSKLVKLLQRSNMYIILVTFEVLKLERLRSESSLQQRNI